MTEVDDEGRSTTAAGGADPRAAMADGSWMAWTTGGIAAIWVAVVLISVFAPDMVTGSEQQHMPMAAFTSWLWGLVSMGAFLWSMGRLRGSAARRPIWVGLAIGTAGLWLVATVLSITLPVVETGSDPTRMPLGAFVSPMAAALLTAIAGLVAGIYARPPTPD